MPIERKIVSYRPDAEEEVLLDKLTRVRATSASRVIGQLVREAADREGFTATAEEIASRGITANELSNELSHVVRRAEPARPSELNPEIL
jgi:hypothetical protein